MRRVKIFSGSSHPALVEAICERLGCSPAPCDLKKFSNGETSVNFNVSVRDQDVFVVQSGSSHINDIVMELLVMISACKGGSAKSITAVMPYFPYSRQSKKKSHRGAITARLLANLLSVAGVHHVITVDLHAPPTQGFFGKPVDNLHAEPLIARWITANVTGWRDAVVVSKNPGGTKRVTSLADTLKLSFGMVTTQPRRSALNTGNSLDGSVFFEKCVEQPQGSGHTKSEGPAHSYSLPNGVSDDMRTPPHSTAPRSIPMTNGSTGSPIMHSRHQKVSHNPSPLTQSTRLESTSPPAARRPIPRPRDQSEVVNSSEPTNSDDVEDDDAEEFNDERARDVITGRLIQGHIVDDDAPSPSLSAMSGSVPAWPLRVDGTNTERIGAESPFAEESDPMALSMVSTLSRQHTEHADPAEVSDEEEVLKDPELEHTVTLVGNVQDRVVFIIDDMIDQPGSWIAAAETVVKRGDAKTVYCIATHGLFGGDALEEMESCECIHHVVVTNTYPIAPQRVAASSKLIILDMSNILAEAIRRNHYGESISALFQNLPD